VAVISRSIADAAKAIGRPGAVEIKRDIFNFLRQKIQSVGMQVNIYIPGPTHNVPDYKVWNITSDNSIETTTSSMDDLPPKKKTTSVAEELIYPTFCFNSS